MHGILIPIGLNDSEDVQNYYTMRTQPRPILNIPVLSMISPNDQDDDLSQQLIFISPKPVKPQQRTNSPFSPKLMPKPSSTSTFLTIKDQANKNTGALMGSCHLPKNSISAKALEASEKVVDCEPKLQDHEGKKRNICNSGIRVPATNLRQYMSPKPTKNHEMNIKNMITPKNQHGEQEQAQPMSAKAKAKKINLFSSTTIGNSGSQLLKLKPKAQPVQSKSQWFPKQDSQSSPLKEFSLYVKKRVLEDPQGMKTNMKLMSSTEISKIHHHPPHSHSQNDIRVFPQFKFPIGEPVQRDASKLKCRQNKQSSQKDISKQTMDTLRSAPTSPTPPLKLPQSPKSPHLQIQPQPRIGQIIMLHSISNSPTIAGDPKYYFQILRHLAGNESTTIFLVRQIITNFLFCLKKCYIRGVDRSQFEFLLTEGKYGGIIDHPFLLKTYCTLYDHDCVYQLLEYMEGSTLYDKTQAQRSAISIKRFRKMPQINPQSETQTKLDSIRLILSALLEATLYLHRNGLVHRDIKPSNVFISHDFTIKLGDFGSCGKIGAREYVGTLDYVSPEVLTKKDYDQRVDIWSIGCVAYQLYTGVPPFYHQLRHTTISNIIQKEFDRQKIEDPLLLDLIERMLEKQIKKRIWTQQAIGHRFIAQPCYTLSPCRQRQKNI